MGEYALPFALKMAKELRKAPRKIAEEIAAAMPLLAGFGPWEVAGAGYINARVDRAALAAAVAKDAEEKVAPEHPGKVLVEHTSINPNKAAHIGHLRNAILGDTFVRLLRSAGGHVDVQNYIDNTGVQVADVVVGFLYINKLNKAAVAKLISDDAAPERAGKPFDYYCWDLYARVSQWYEQSPDNKALRLKTLHDIEQGGNEAADIGELVSTAVLHRHLETM